MRNDHKGVIMKNKGLMDRLVSIICYMDKKEVWDYQLTEFAVTMIVYLSDSGDGDLRRYGNRIKQICSRHGVDKSTCAISEKEEVWEQEVHLSKEEITRRAGEIEKLVEHRTVRL